MGKQIKIWYPTALLDSGDGDGYISVSYPETIVDVINGEYRDYMRSPRCECKSITLFCGCEDNAARCHKLLDVLADKVLKKELLYLPDLIVASANSDDHGGSKKAIGAKVKALNSMWNRFCRE